MLNLPPLGGGIADWRFPSADFWRVGLPRVGTLFLTLFHSSSTLASSSFASVNFIMHLSQLPTLATHLLTHQTAEFRQKHNLHTTVVACQ